MEPGNLDFFQPLGDCEDICQVGEPLIQAVDQGKDEQQQVCQVLSIRALSVYSKEMVISVLVTIEPNIFKL